MVADAVQRNRSLWQRKSRIREKYREDQELGPKKSFLRQEKPESPKVFRPVPLQRLTGLDFGITGKRPANNRERVLTFPHAWLYCRRRSRAASGPLADADRHAVTKADCTKLDVGIAGRDSATII